MNEQAKEISVNRGNGGIEFWECLGKVFRFAVFEDIVEVQA